MSLTLEDRVKLFSDMPLIDDLWKEVQRLRQENQSLQPEDGGAGYYDLVKEISRLNAHITKQDNTIERLQKSANFSDLYVRSIQADMGEMGAELASANAMLDARDDLLAKRRTELDQTRSDAANVVRALDAAVQYAETLLAFLAEEGTPLHPNVVGAWAALQEALTTIGVRKP